MANLVATREALERFAADIPAASLTADRLRRAAETTRALVQQALDTPDRAPTLGGWIDHNLAVLVAEGLADSHDATRKAAGDLFHGSRRRIAEALEADRDDLALALALARGAAQVRDDDRLSADVALVAGALSRPQAGLSLVSAAVELVVRAARSKSDAVKAGAEAVAPTVRESAERLAGALPNHPDVGLQRVRLLLLEARAHTGAERAQLLDKAHGLLTDHDKRFGSTAGARKLLSELLELRARSGASGTDIRRDALALLEAGVHERSLGPKQASRLIRAIERAKALDEDTAARLRELLDDHIGEDQRSWRDVLGRLLVHAGDDAALVGHWQRALRDDPKDTEAARGLAARMVKNLRTGLELPFDSEILERVLERVPYQEMARWTGEDINQVLGVVQETFGTNKAAEFLANRLLATRDLRGREALWKRALDLYDELGDAEGALDVARKAVKHSGLARARLALARILLDRGEHLDEAEAALKPLLEARGAESSEAHKLKAQLSRHPGIRETRRSTLLAFEHKIGVGTEKKFDLAVVYTARNYVLVEATRYPAPEFYEHKHLRTMVRAEDLPKWVSTMDLRKGDVIRAPIRGQDGDPRKDKETIRIYWVADPKQIELELDETALVGRWAEEERRFHIGGDQPALLKVGKGKKGDLYARILRKGGREFPVRAKVEAAQLPEGSNPDRLGKGKRMWGLVRQVPGAVREYEVVGTLTTEDPNAPPPEAAKPEAAKPEAAKAPAPKPEATAAPAPAPPAQAAAPAPTADGPPAPAPAAQAAAPAPTAEAAPVAAPPAQDPPADSAPAPVPPAQAAAPAPAPEAAPPGAAPGPAPAATAPAAPAEPAAPAQAAPAAEAEPGAS